MNTLNKDIEVIDENGIWQLVKEGDRYAIRTCYIYEDYEEYDTYRLPNDLAEAVFTNYMEPSSCPLEVVQPIFSATHKVYAVPLATHERLAMSLLDKLNKQEVTWEQLMNGEFGEVYPHLAQRGLIEKADPSNSLLALLGGADTEFTLAGFYSMEFANRLLKVADQ